MAKRQCAFCPEPATTGEHLWSNWVNSLLGEKRKYVIERNIQGANRKWISVGLHEKFPVLCDDCNNVWGSDIENEMKNVSASMVKDGNGARLSAEDVAAIATYAQLKAFVCDYAQEDVKFFYDTAMRRSFRDDLAFPLGTNIWLGHTVDYHGVFKSAYGKTPQNTPKRFYSYVFTISLGQLVVQLTSVRWTKKSNRRYTNPPFLTQAAVWDRFSLPIFPRMVRIPTLWPPEQQLDRDEMDDYFFRWQVLERADSF